jgi:hypothetical protein
MIHRLHNTKSSLPAYACHLFDFSPNPNTPNRALRYSALPVEMPKPEKHRALASHLCDVRHTIHLIKSRGLVAQQFTPSKQHIYGRLISQLENHLEELENALNKDEKLWTRLRNRLRGFDIEKQVLELRLQSFGFWETLNKESL